MNIVKESCPTYKKKFHKKLSREKALLIAERRQEWMVAQANAGKPIANMGMRGIGYKRG